MDLCDDDAPSLVRVNQSDGSAPALSVTQMDSLSLTKVPLTIVTEFGDSTDIEKALTVTQDGQSTQEWLELGNGCICCSIKDQGVNAIESLMDRRGTFDYIMLETSGLADPGNLAPLFWVDDELGSSIYLDGVVTLVDAKNILISLDEKPAETEEAQHDGPHATTAHLQISHADVIIINKCDSITPAHLLTVETRIRAINGLAKIHRTSYSQVPQLESFLLDLHAYDGIDTLDVASQGHSHLDPTISTISLSLPPIAPSDLPHLESWLRGILWDSILPFPPSTNPQSPSSLISIHRLKGLIHTTTPGDMKMIQGVREVFEILDRKDCDGGMGRKEVATTTEEGERAKEGKLVLIGRGLDHGEFARSLKLWFDGR